MKGIEKKYSYIILSVIEILLSVILYFWHQFSDAKMGMVRHITFWNTRKFPKIFSEKILYIIVGIIILLVILQFLKIKKLPILGQAEVSLNLFLTLVASTFILRSNVEKEFIYYYIVIYLVLLLILQFIKVHCYRK